MNEIIHGKINLNEMRIEVSNNFTCKNNNEILPIPVVSNVSTSNTQHFLNHVILLMDNYETEIDALCHSSFR